MDPKNVRVLKPYEEEENNKEFIIYIDNYTRIALGNIDWDSKIEVIGKKNVTAKIKSLKDFDQGGQIARASVSLLDALEIEVGEEVLLATKK